MAPAGGSHPSNYLNDEQLRQQRTGQQDISRHALIRRHVLRMSYVVQTVVNRG
jgi:hypothetical protein